MNFSCLEYPFDYEFLNRKKKSLKRELENQNIKFLEKKIAILGGSTTNEIKLNLELFLLKEGIKPIFFESEYNKYYEDAIFSKELEDFSPEIVYIHTTIKNLENFPSLSFSKEKNQSILENAIKKFKSIWDSLFSKFSCVIIQNNFEYPQYRLIGNSSVCLDGGNVKFINNLNSSLVEATEEYKNLYINDINYLASLVGLEKWYDNSLWFNYKYALSFEAIPYLSHSVASIIKGIYGKNKKAIAVDLDNTLWGGVIGDDGIVGIKIGKDNPIGEAHIEFQNYLKKLKELGIVLTIASKNDEENAIEGLEYNNMLLHKNDFLVIKANWEPKPNNILESADEINIGVDSFVFLDDNPVERELVKNQLQGVAVPNIDNKVENYQDIVDRDNYFEFLSVSEEDLQRLKYYEDNQNREKEKLNYENYQEYLKSLDMLAEIQEAKDIYLERIHQLINKTNQFNLTTKRYTKAEVEEVFHDENSILLYGRLQDKFGDNGLVSIVIGKKENKVLNIPLWIMSCRVLKRDMEKAMLDSLVEICKIKDIEKIVGKYIPSSKNSMVKNHYMDLGFKLIEDNDNITTWELDICEYKNKNEIIKIGEY